MSEKEFRKYVELIASMSLDYLQGDIGRQHYIDNLKSIIENLEEEAK